MILRRLALMKFKRRLLKERKKILNNLEELKNLPDVGSETDPDTETDESEEISNRLATKEILKKRLADIEFALVKIKKGTYGICENCKKEIPIELLKIAPESQLCKECKEKIRA